MQCRDEWCSQSVSLLDWEGTQGLREDGESLWASVEVLL
jgi:hypothetical protein